MHFLVIGLLFIFVIAYLEFKLKAWREETLISSFKRNFNIINLLSISFLFASLMLLISLMLEKCGVFTSVSESFRLETLPYILYSVTIVPFMEEYFYRFLPCKIFVYPQYSKYIATISSFLFAVSHLLVGFEYVYIFCMAMILFYIFFKSKNILYSVCAHSVYNIFVYFNYYLGFDNIVILLLIILVCVMILFNTKIKSFISNFSR